jgi:hypothetical protein
MTAVFCDIYLFSISRLFKILGWGHNSYVGSVLKKSCQKAARDDEDSDDDDDCVLAETTHQPVGGLIMLFLCS